MPGGERSEHFVWIPGARMADSWTEARMSSAQASGAWHRSNSAWDRRASATVDLDEITAALVLSSLSCSPRVNLSYPAPEPVVGDSRKRLGSGNSSDCGTGDSSSPSPPPLSKPITTAPRRDGVNLRDPRPPSPEESEPRKCRGRTAGRTQSGNSVKPSYRCMWPCCDKSLSSTVGIRRHIRTIHLCHGDSEHSNGEEDFYYTEIQAGAERCSESPGVPRCASSFPGPRFTEAVGPQQLSAPDVAAPTTPTLSRSAPSCLRQVCVDHTFQVSPESSCSFTLVNLSSPPQVALLKPRIVFASTPAILHGGKKVRGEAKKCRKVYGVENRSQWCTACRWKKACQRFHD
ncbi:zinc finger protein 395-like isoform X2 [Hypanus sabinus]|uniref:zinc finger protein 395-like isoform X2 n=1 Tax=Hypanus sabinus TaxID=79690 RepID=UPI0028C422A5|nr:zinc finger protein 395-like isoform X2 [Hypanus sabinus]